MAKVIVVKEKGQQRDFYEKIRLRKQTLKMTNFAFLYFVFKKVYSFLFMMHFKRICK